MKKLVSFVSDEVKRMAFTGMIANCGAYMEYRWKVLQQYLKAERHNRILYKKYPHDKGDIFYETLSV